MAYLVNPINGNYSSQLFRNIMLGYFGGSLSATSAEVRANARQVYKRHYEDIRTAAATQGRPVLDYELGSGWEPLCRFLDKPIPDQPFPKVNEYDFLKQRIVQSRRKALVSASRIIAAYALPVAVALAAIWLALLSLDGHARMWPWRG